MLVQIKHSLAHLQDLTSNLAGIKYISKNTSQSIRIKSCRYARECFICTCIWLHVFELTVTGWCIIIIAIHSCFELTTCVLTFVAIPTSFFKSKIFIYLVCLLFIEYQLASYCQQLNILCSYNPIRCVYGLCWSYVARCTFVQSITTSDMALDGRGCYHASMELHVVVSANVYNSYNNLFV